MKILQIFGAVVAVHLVAFVFIFASPGCQSGPRNVPTPDATLPSGSAATSDTGAVLPAPVDLGTPAPTYSVASSSAHPVPTRPGSPNAAVLTPAHQAEDVAPVSTYAVGKGDSLWSIAKKNHLTVAELAKANNLGAGAALRPGQKLIIPGKVSAPAPKDVGAAGKATATAADKAPAATSHAPTESVKHTVQPGESLGIIARKYQVTTGELAAANSITDPSKVRAGQVLIIPGFKAVGTRGTVKPAAANGTTKPAPATTAPVDAPATATVKTPHFEIAAPPPGQDLDSGLKEPTTEVPTIKVEPSKADQPPKK